MNPTFLACQTAIMKASINMMLGIPHVPKNQQLSQTDGKLFAQKGDPVAEAEAAEVKEREVRAHLNKLAAEAKARSDAGGFS